MRSLCSWPLARSLVSGERDAPPLENLCISSSRASQSSHFPHLCGFCVTVPYRKYYLPSRLSTQRKALLSMRFSERCDSRDACDGRLRVSLEVPSSSNGWWHSALRRFGTPARLLQTLRPTSPFGHPLYQAQSGPRVSKSRVVAARQLLVLVATPP